MSNDFSNGQAQSNSNQSEQIEGKSEGQSGQLFSSTQSECTADPSPSQNASEDQLKKDGFAVEDAASHGPASDTSSSAIKPDITLSDAASQPIAVSNPTDSDTNSTASNSATAAPSGLGASVAPTPPAKKFTSLSVNKRFLEKTSPIASPNLKAGSASPVGASNSVSNGVGSGVGSSGSAARSLGSSPSNQSRLSASKLPVGGNPSDPSSTNWSSSKSSSETPPSKTQQESQNQFNDSLTNTDTTTLSAAPTATSSLQNTMQASSASSASPKLLTSMSNSRVRASGIPSGLKSSAGEPRRKGSPGLKNAVLASSGAAAGRSSSPGGSQSTNSHIGSSSHNDSGRLAPWATLKSSKQSSKPTPLSSTWFNSNLLSDFPTAAEVVNAKKLHEERLAHHAAEEAARQEKTLQDLERFRGMTHSGSGTQWDELEDGEEDDFLDGVVEFADGTKYEISNTLEDNQHQNQQEQQQQQLLEGEAEPQEPQAEVTKEERFKDVSHDRSWPPNQNSEHKTQLQVEDQSQKRSGSFQPSTILSSTVKQEPPSRTISKPPWGHLNAAATSSVRDLPPHSRAQNMPLSPQDGNSSSRRFSFGRSSGWDSRTGERGGLTESGSRSGGRPIPTIQSETAPTQAAPSSARAWGTLARREALLNPDAPKPTATSTSSTIKSPQISAPVAAPAAAAAPPQHPPSKQTVRDTVSMKSPQASAPAPAPEAAAAVAPSPDPTWKQTVRDTVSMASNGPAPPASSTSAAQIISRTSPASQAVAAANPWNSTRQASANPFPASGPSAAVSTPAPNSTVPATTTVNLSGSSSVSSAQPAIPSESTAVKSLPVSTGNALLPNQNDPQRSDMLTAAERARRRREEEEKARAAEKERAQKKAAEIEERMRAQKEDKERKEKEKRLEEERIEREKVEEERLQKEKEKKAIAGQKRSESAGSQGQQKQEVQNEIWRRSATALPPQSLARNQKRTPSNQAIDDLSSRSEKARQALAGKISLKTAKDPPRPETTASAHNTIFAPSQIDLPPPSETRAASVSPSTEATSWRRSGPLPSRSEPVKQDKIRNAPQIQTPDLFGQQEGSTAPAATSRSPSSAVQIEVQKQILPRQAPRSPTITAPSPAQPRTQTSPSTSRAQLSPTSPSKSLANLDDLLLRVKGAMSVQSLTPSAPAVSVTPGSVAPGSTTTPIGPASSRTVSGAPTSQPIQIQQRPADAAASHKDKMRGRDPVSSSTQFQPQLHSQQHPPQPARHPARPESQTTRSEVPMDPPPVWNKFAVRIKKSKPTSKTRSNPAKRVRIEVPGGLDVSPVYPLTWEPPIPALSTKTLSRDAQFFPRAFHKGRLIISVSIPMKRLAKSSVRPRARVPVPGLDSPTSETLEKPEPIRTEELRAVSTATTSIAQPFEPAITSTVSPTPRVNMPKPAVKLPTPAAVPEISAAQQARTKGSSNETSWRQSPRTAISLETPPYSNPPSAPAAMRSAPHPSSSPSPAPATRTKAIPLATPVSQQAASFPSPNPGKNEVRSPFKAAVSAAVSQANTSAIDPSSSAATTTTSISASTPPTAISPALSSSSKAPGSTNQQSKGRRGSAVAFHPSMSALGKGRDTLSPVSFMVRSELESSSSEAGVGSSGSSALSGQPVSISGRSNSANQTPGSTSSVLPSPNSLGGSATWGFPVLDRGTPLLPDSDHLKSVWALSPSGHPSREVQNSLKGIADDFLPSTIPLSVQDLNGEDGASSSDVNGAKGSSSPNAAASGRFDAGTNTGSFVSEHQRSQSHSSQQPVGARGRYESASRTSPSSPFQQNHSFSLPSIPVNEVAPRANGQEIATADPSRGFESSSSQQFHSSKPRRFNQAPSYSYGSPNTFTSYAAGNPYLSPGVAAPALNPQHQPPFGGYSPFAAGPAPYYSPFAQSQRLPPKSTSPSALGIGGQAQSHWGSENEFGSSPGNAGVGMGLSNAAQSGHLQHQSPQLRNSGLNVRSPAFTPSFSQNTSSRQPNNANSSSASGDGNRAPPPHMFQQSYAGRW